MPGGRHGRDRLGGQPSGRGPARDTEIDVAGAAGLGIGQHARCGRPLGPGPARVAEGAYVWQKLLKSGARIASGSDFPVEQPNPMLGFYAAITRQDSHGQPPQGWAADQRLSRDQALASFTTEAAWAAHAERDLGSIEVGKLADFVVLSRDIMTVAPADVLGAEVRLTFIGGRRVFPYEP